MTARRLLTVVESMLLEANGREAIEEWLAPVDRTAERQERVARLAELGVEVA
jgi:hypothetical protein